MTLLWLFPIAYGVWRMMATTVILRIHRDDPDEKIVLVPTKEPLNPLVMRAGYLRRRGRRTRARWLGLMTISALGLLGVVSGVTALLLFVAWYLTMKGVPTKPEDDVSVEGMMRRHYGVEGFDRGTCEDIRKAVEKKSRDDRP